MTKYCCEDGGNNQFKLSTKSYFQDLKKIFIYCMPYKLCGPHLMPALSYAFL